MKKFLAFALASLIFLSNYGVALAKPAAENADAYILIDAETGSVLCEKNSQARLYPASTTKIITAVLAIEMGDLDQVMTASQSAIDDIGPDGSNIGIIPGEKIRLENLLQALLICSANEAANIIAENICATREEFVGLMNRKARELGATGTNFTNTSGIHDPDHYTTAADMAILARYAMTLPKFREIVRVPSLAMPPTNKHLEWPALANTNRLLTSLKKDTYEVNGIKTGFTGPAGYNLVASAVDSSGMELISVVMGVRNKNAYENVRKYSEELLDYGFNNFKKVILLEKGKVYRNVKVENAADVFGLDLITAEGLKCILPKETSTSDIQEISHISDSISAPINEGDIMGYVEFLKDGVSIGKINLIAARNVDHAPIPETAFPYIKIGLYVAGFVVFFIMLKTILRRISRMVHSRR
ncbi:MAG: D-alanyl-D-alanine carboxypeptidase family protein [Bacillota bacterium]